MKSTPYFAISAIYFILFVITTTTARSFLDIIDDSMKIKMVSSPSSARTKRAAPDECPVHPDTPVAYHRKNTYFNFNADQRAPAPFPGENEGISCPESEFGDWWPGMTTILAASCPWTWTTYDSWKLAPGHEVYPRYITQAKCLCRRCVNKKSMGCRKLKRKFLFYYKSGCQGNQPIFLDLEFNITVGCYCTKY